MEFNNAFGYEQQQQQAKTHLTSLILINTRQKQDMVQRGLNLNVTNRDRHVLGEALNQFGKISPELVATNTPGILTMGVNPDLKVGIINGWQQERFIFILKTKTRQPDGGIRASYIQGYTNYAGVSKNGAIDHTMTYYVNSVITVVERSVPGTNRITHHPLHAFTIVYDRLTNAKQLKHNDDMFRLLRPTDVLIELHSSVPTDDYQQGIPTINTSSKLGFNVNTSKASNKIASNQICTVINNVSSVISRMPAGGEPSDIYMGAAGLASEHDVTDVDFLRELGYNLGRTTVEFTHNDMLQIDPNIVNHMDVKWTIPDQVNINPLDLAQNQNILLTNDPETLQVSTQEARIASIIAESASGMLADLSLSTIMFTVQSGIVSIEPIFTPLNYNSEIPVLDLEQAVMRFEASFLAMVVPQLTNGGHTAIDILVNIDLLNESRISVSVNMQAPVVFAVPTYSNSLFDSVIASPNKVHTGLREYKNLLSLLVEE